MPKSNPKLALSVSRDIPFDKLVLSQSNVRRIKAGVGIEELAEDIARRTLLQSLTVRAVLDEAGQETGMFEVPSGGRRYRALELLVKRKRLPRNAPVPCILRTEGDAEEDSLAENIQRAPLHPLDQFRAFLALREKGQTEEEMAAHQFVSVAVVKQRLKLASVSPRILDAYAEDEITLDQLMAFTVNGDHERQEQVYERLAVSHDRQPYAIRRMLTEGAVRASDKRARFIDVDAYVEAGGSVMRDLFQGDDGGWLQDVRLVDLMVSERLREEAMKVRSEGWRWIDAAPDFPYGHTYGLRQLRGMPVEITAEEQATRDALQAEYDALTAEYEDAPELPDEVDERLGELETAIEALDQRPLAYDADEVTRAGAFISIAPDGSLRVERGYVRPEDELPVEPELATVAECDSGYADGSTGASSDERAGGEIVIDVADPAPEPDEDQGLRPIPDRLMSELTAHRTLALRDAVAQAPEVAFLACLHALVLKLFYRYALDSCLELDIKHIGFGHQAPGLVDTASAQAMDARHQAFADVLPAQPEALWDALGGMDEEQRRSLFAHCVACTVNAMFEVYNRRPRALAHAGRLAQAVDLDMAAAGWTPTVDAFLGRVTKARIVQAVAEAKGERTAEGIAHLKKGDMAARAAVLLEGTGWLPEPLRTPGRALPASIEDEAESATSNAPTDTDAESVAQPATNDGARSVVEEEPIDDNDAVEGDTPFTGPDAGKGAAGKWTDAATGEHGDLLDLIAANQRLASLADTLEEARFFLSLPAPEPQQSRRQAPAPAGSSEATRRLWGMSRPIHGTLAETYLHSRGIVDLRGCGCLRFHPHCWYRADEDDPSTTPEAFPALIASVRDNDGKLTGVHRTWLDLTGNEKAPVVTPRRAMGELLGNGVRFGQADTVMIAGEGIETVLSLRQILPAMPMIAALSAAHLAALQLPPTLRRLYIARDSDDAGRHAAAALAGRAQSTGVEPLLLDAQLGDFNDDLRRIGAEAMRADVRVQLAPEDAEQFIG